MENMENKMQTTELSPREEYHQEFLPQVHKIGATTMAIALILSLLPTVYFVFIKGIEVPLSTFISVMIAIFTFAIGIWLSEPAAFWPVLGFCRHLLCLPRRQCLRACVCRWHSPPAAPSRAAMTWKIPVPMVAMIIALFASVVVNLAILLSIVLIGDGLISILPAGVLAAFNFVMPCLLANNILMQSKGPDGTIIKGFLKVLPYLLTGVAAQLLVKNVFTFLSNYGILLAVVLSVLVAYGFYRRDLAAHEKQNS